MLRAEFSSSVQNLVPSTGVAARCHQLENSIVRLPAVAAKYEPRTPLSVMSLVGE